MIFRELDIDGVYEIELEPVQDERGSFARIYSRDELATHGIDFEVVHANLSRNLRRGTLRGMHLQKPPHEEAKLVRCVTGSIYDVALDLRPRRPTQLRWVAVQLTAERRNALFIPPGFAHGFLTLEDKCEVEYLVSAAYEPSAAVGVRWDDPAVGIDWPFLPTVMLERDATYPNIDISRLGELGPVALG